MRKAHTAADTGLETVSVLETDSVLGDTPDDDLLRRFLATRDEAAFAALVARHGSLVMGVCQRVVGNRQDAEDAFQATFLILARKAATVRSAVSLPAWLHKTAHRTALKARMVAARRREQSLEVESVVASQPLAEIAADFDRTLLDQELNRLPEKYRLPLFLCAIEGKSREEAAQQLGWSASVLKGRLERGRALLRRRLALSGVSMSALLLTASVGQAASAPTVVSSSLLAATVQAGLQQAAGQSVAGCVSQNVVSLVHGSFQTMSLATKVVCGSLTLFTAVAVGASLLPASPPGSGSGSAQGYFLEATLGPGQTTAVALLADGEGAKPGPRDGERPSGGLRDGERPAAGPRDGERPATGPRDGERPATGARDGEGAQPAGLGGFQPQTPREAALLQMIMQMQAELADLRGELSQMRGGAAGPAGEPAAKPAYAGGETGNAAVPPLPANFERSSEGRVFKAYDKNGDQLVTFDEWLGMRAIAADDVARRQLEARRFQEADPNNDGKMTTAEFAFWYTKARFQNNNAAAARLLQGEGGAKPGARDGEGGARPGARDGEGGARPGPRDGEGGAKVGPRDGDR